MSVLVKICGVTRVEDAEAAVAAGADWIGLNFWPRSRRHIDVETAVKIAAVIPGDVKKVGVFVNAPSTQVEQIAARVGLDLLQFHGDEDAAYLAPFTSRAIRALRVQGVADLRGGRLAVHDATDDQRHLVARQRLPRGRALDGVLELHRYPPPASWRKLPSSLSPSGVMIDSG